MLNRVWEHLRLTSGALPARPDTWPAQAPAHFQSLARTGAFDALASPAVVAGIDGLLGRPGWRLPDRWGRPLVTFPQHAPWRLPVSGWHLDSTDRPGDPVLVVFACLAPVRPEGGGTLVVTGSHRLTGAGGRYAGLRSAQVRDRLAADSAWFRDLLTPGDEPDRTARLLGSSCPVDCVELEIAELTGQAGDVVLMHPRLLHAVAPNALDTPRVMLLHFLQQPRRQGTPRRADAASLGSTVKPGLRVLAADRAVNDRPGAAGRCVPAHPASSAPAACPRAGEDRRRA
jgi:hypothetical protein